MQKRGLFALSFALPVVWLAASLTVTFLIQPAAQAEAVKVTGATLNLVHGNPEDRMRYRFEPKPGYIVQATDEDSFSDMYCGRETTFFWEEFGPKANFGFRGHFTYLNGSVFAVQLTNSATWQWLAGATEKDLSGVRYIEIQGVPPAEFATILARLPKKKIIVHCGDSCLPSLPDALSLLDPVGLIVENADDLGSSDLKMLPFCTFMSVELRGSTELRLPPALKVLIVSVGHGLYDWQTLAKVEGAENSLESVELGGVEGFSNWIPGYRILKDVSIPGGFRSPDDYSDFAKAMAQLTALQALSFNPEGADVSFLSALTKLRCLLLGSNPPDISAIAGLKELEFLQVEQPSSCDVQVLSGLKRLKRLVLTIQEYHQRKSGLPYPFDLAVLAPVIDKVVRIAFYGSIFVQHPERMKGMESLEQLDIGGAENISLDCLSSLGNLRCLTGLSVDDRDISQLAKIRHLESLRLSTLFQHDLSGLKDCTSLRELTISAYRRLEFDSLASLTSLTSLSITSVWEPREKADAEAIDCKALGQLKGLKSLNVRIPGLKSAEFLGSLDTLVRLSIWEFDGTDLTVLGKMRSLRHLSLYGCKNVAASSAIRLPIGLRSFFLGGCDALADLTFLDGAANLEMLEISECGLIAELPKLSEPLTCLTDLLIESCRRLKETSNIALMPAIERLVISGFSGWRIAGFDSLASVYDLTLQAPALECLPKAAPGTTIVRADIYYADRLSSLDGIETWRELRRLSLNVSEGVSDVTPLQSLSKLRELALDGCKSVRDLSPLTKMTGLKALYIHRCAFSNAENNALLRKALPGCRIQCRE
ncbi:MAG: hypothetical protein WC712_08835 [Candidatus Brocadiia bacterium]